MTAPATASTAAAPPKALRYFARFQLLRLLGKSTRTMAWLVMDPRAGQELVLVLPRTQAADDDQLDRWRASARRAARINHPGLAQPVEVGDHDRWPFIAYERGEAAQLTEHLTAQGLPAADLARWSVQVLEGLAFAHEAGSSHDDLQPWSIAVGENGQARLMGLAAALPEPAPVGASHVDPVSLQRQRRAGERDVLAFGLVLHHAIAGHPALDEADTAKVMALMPPAGREIVRLPWAMARPVAEPLRAIVNRATDRQERQRYRNARTLARALAGWIKTDAEQGGGPIALLLDRLHSVGVLPALPGAADRAARMALLERERTSELADIVIQDPALSFEMLRAVNTASVRGGTVASNDPVLSMRRAVALLGLDGVRRCALALRPWPGPLDEAGADMLRRLIDQVRLAGRVAVLIRPAGYDPEVVTLLTMLQSLGRLMVQYHFPDEAQQIRRLMQPAPPQRPGESEEPGMSEEAASFAVLGTDQEALGAAVARHLGLDDGLLQMMRRLPLGTPPRLHETDDELLRATAACANECVDAQALGVARVPLALNGVVQRYGRALGVTARGLQRALQGLPPEEADDHPGAGPAHAPGGAAHRASTGGHA